MDSPSSIQLSSVQRIFLLIISFAIALLLFVMRIGMDLERPLDVLARNSLEPEIALNNGIPTIIEFYADWCEVCQEMAPTMLNFKQKYEDKIDIVMLNVDNDKWLDLIEKYEVNGIPQLSLFDENGLNKGKLIGLKRESEFEDIADFILGKKSLLNLNLTKNINTIDVSVSPINKENNSKSINPMSHS